MQIKTAVKCHLTLVRMTIAKKPTKRNGGESVGQKELSYTLGVNIRWCSHYGEQFGGSLKKKIKDRVTI